MNLSTLTLERGFWYLATPYSRYPRGMSSAAFDAASIAGRLMLRGVQVYCPIAHGHAIAGACSALPLDHEFWMAACRPFMEASHGLIVATMDGWHESRGVIEETDWFEEQGKPSHLIDPLTLEIVHAA